MRFDISSHKKDISSHKKDISSHILGGVWGFFSGCPATPFFPSGAGGAAYLFGLSVTPIVAGYCSPAQRVAVVPVAPEAVGGLYGKLAQYCAIACAILRLVSSLRRLPVLAAAILSFCVCGISLRQILFAIVFIFVIVIIGYIVLIIYIVPIVEKSTRGKIYAPICSPPMLSDGTGNRCSR